MSKGRFIIALLILTVVFSNMAWAMDVCVQHADLTEQSISPTTNTAPDNGSEYNSCDIFCHCCMQLLYISSHTSPVNTRNSHFAIIYTPSFYHSLQRKPPTEPPQV